MKISVRLKREIMGRKINIVKMRINARSGLSGRW
jgi:hypothetical protein